MQSTKTNRLTLLALTASLLALVACLPMFTFAAGPTGQPTGTNVDANFASISFPNSAGTPRMTSSFGKFVGLSASKLSANQGSYAKAKAVCASYGAGAHVCTAKELINSYEYAESGATTPASSTELLWINNGPPGYIYNNANDCSGWTKSTAGNFGYVWLPDSTKKYAMITSCTAPHYFACCSF